jgi:hypothetical protein
MCGGTWRTGYVCVGVFKYGEVGEYSCGVVESEDVDMKEAVEDVGDDTRKEDKEELTDSFLTFLAGGISDVAEGER